MLFILYYDRNMNKIIIIGNYFFANLLKSNHDLFTGVRLFDF